MTYRSGMLETAFGTGGGAASWPVSGTPSTFPPEAHDQAISTITGLQAALDGKQAAGSYAAASHTHVIGDVTGLQTALDAKQATLVSGTNIKTVNGESLLGSGNIAALGGGSDPWTYVKLASNSTVSTTAFANVTGMSFVALANTTYLVEVIGAYQTAATTTGIGLALDIPSGSVVGMNIVSTSATALGGTEQIADATTTGATTGVRALNTNTPIIARWVVAIGATPGTVQLMQRSEIAGSNTVLQSGLTIMGSRVI